MICIKSNCLFFFSCYFYREWLTILIGQIYLLANHKIFRTRKLCNFKSKDCIRICHTISFFRHQMNIYNLANFHIRNCRIKSSDHLTGSADKFQWFSTVIRRIKLCSIIKSSSVMCTACFSHIASCNSSLCTAAATTTASTGTTFFMTSTGMSLFVSSAGMSFSVVITIHAGRYQFPFQISLYCLICISLRTCTQFNVSLTQSSLSTAADTTTDQNIHALLCKQTCQSTMSAAIRTDHFTGNNFLALNFIYLKRFCFSKMLKNISIVISYCNFHV